MPSPNPPSRGLDLATRLQDACREVALAPLPGARDLPVVAGITPRCVFVEPLENVRARATELLADSTKVFVHHEAIVYELDSGGNRRLLTLSRSGAVEAVASAILANLFVCEHAEPGRDPMQFGPPQQFVALLLSSSPVRAALPTISVYATRPIFDAEFILQGPGWHPETGVLVHGPDVEPMPHEPPGPGTPALDRLPPRLRALMTNFCFRSPADVVAAVAAMITGLLANRFAAVGKAIVLIDGNQPGLGKTLLARVIGIILDGGDPRAIHFTLDDEELAKRLCATIRDGTASVVLIDNAKLKAGGVVSSPVLEANSMAPVISLRILGQSANFVRPNDLTWFLTMNDTKTSPDLLSRGLPIRLRYEGDPRHREFAGAEPIAFANAHRAELLGELAGMVVRWNLAGRPAGAKRHRCDEWARTIGGILEVAGLPEFLDNLDEAAASFNSVLDEVSALAEAVLAQESPESFSFDQAPDADESSRPLKGRAELRPIWGMPAGGWEPLFRRASVQGPALEAAKSQQAKATLIGNFLSTNLNREVPIQVQSRTGRARLVAFDGAQRQKRYAFAMSWDAPAPRRLLGGLPPDRPGRDVPSPIAAISESRAPLTAKASTGQPPPGLQPDPDLPEVSLGEPPIAEVHPAQIVATKRHGDRRRQG